MLYMEIYQYEYNEQKICYLKIAFLILHAEQMRKIVMHHLAVNLRRWYERLAERGNVHDDGKRQLFLGILWNLIKIDVNVKKIKEI